MKKLCDSKVCCLLAKECRKVNNSKSDRFKYEMIGDTQPEMEVTFSCPFSLKSGSSIASATRS